MSKINFEEDVANIDQESLESVSSLLQQQLVMENDIEIAELELKDKKARVEDAIYATKAALIEGIVPGGGVALLNASEKIQPKHIGENILLNSIKSPFTTIINNGGILGTKFKADEGFGINVLTGKKINMIDAGIVDPVLVTKSALKNAVSVATTIMSADCVISNIRVNESS